MKPASNFLLGVACLALAALACSAISGGGEPTPITLPVVPTAVLLQPTTVPDSPLPTEAPPSNNGGEVLFKDDFVPGRGEWGTGSDADRTVEYVEETLSIKIPAANYFVWTTPNDEDYSNVHIEVTAYNHNTDSHSGFGIICNQQFIEDSMYYFVVTPAGEYAIVLAALAQDDNFLTNGGWETSDLIARNAESYRIGADCGNGKLTLYVDGQVIASVDDSTYAAGGFALFGLSGQQTGATEVRFDDFVMTQLP
jgi:hypothetical protein